MASQDEREKEASSPNPDPLEEQTQPMTTSGVRASDDAAPEPVDLETTTWSGAAAPPPLIEEDPIEEEPIEEEAIEESQRLGEAEETIVAEPEPDSGGGADSLAGASPEVDSTESLLDAGAAEPPPSQPIAPSSSLHPLLLERIDPSLGRGERLRLDAAHWKVSLGRAETNDIRLYTASASREHAVIAGNEAGEWILTPGEGRSVLIDGDETTEPVVLEVGMNLVLGSDHLRCVTEGLSRPAMSAQTSAEGFDSGSAGWAARLGSVSLSTWLILAIAALGLGLIAFAWLSG